MKWRCSGISRRKYPKMDILSRAEYGLPMSSLPFQTEVHCSKRQNEVGERKPAIRRQGESGILFQHFLSSDFLSTRFIVLW